MLVPNPRHWHDRIAALETSWRPEGLAATPDPNKMVFTNRNEDAKGTSLTYRLNFRRMGHRRSREHWHRHRCPIGPRPQRYQSTSGVPRLNSVGNPDN
ncbi:MAG: hypothetical protein EYR95_02450 [Phormidium sp. SL48-SHIP]|nr:MAG: hypothetical protein EYR95_02450 [Phormidium sp. SL48-SHIP]